MSDAQLETRDRQLDIAMSRVAHSDDFKSLLEAGRYFLERKETAKRAAEARNDEERKIYRQHFDYCNSYIKHLLNL